MKFLFLYSLLLSSYSFAKSHDFQCGGTEPFWALKLKKNSGTFSSPTFEKGLKFQITESEQFSGMRETFGSFKKIILPGKESGSVVLQKNTCDDSMSDNLYHYSIIINSKTLGTLYGCCNAKELHMVTGVVDDTLNVRSKPNAKSKIVYQLPEDFYGIELKKCEGQWCNIQFSKKIDGWVNKKFIKPFKP